MRSPYLGRPVSAYARSPYPWFGGKSKIARAIWDRLGDPPHVIDPFFGSNAFLIARPQWDWQRGCWIDDRPRLETVNDADGFLVNLWRAIVHDPEAVAYYADWPVSEADLHARHASLLKHRDLTERLMSDPEYFDAKIAGWWLWGICCWVGSGWCSGRVTRKRPELRNSGRGVHRQRPPGTSRDFLIAWMQALSARFRMVRICCGDWTRVLGPSVTAQRVTGVFLDPPYSPGRRYRYLYAIEPYGVSRAVRDWAIAHGNDPRLRIALCGYWGEHSMPPGWSALRWTAPGGYGLMSTGRGRQNRTLETVWFSPFCLQPQLRLF